jgi:alanine-synthesizing transaminase
VLRPAPHIANVKYAIRNIAQEASRLEAQGRRIVACNIGDPLKYDFPTPPHLVAAVEKAMHDGLNGYGPSAGVQRAREAVAADANKRGMPLVRPSNVFITAGASEAIDLTLTSLLEPGDEVLLPSPGYPLYNAIAARLNAVAVSYYLDESKNWAIDPDELESHITPRTRAIVICNPNNPTGAVLNRATLERVIDVARRHQLALLTDEIYDKLRYDGTHVPTGSLADDVPIIMFNGLSKAYLACGWRVGWLAFVNPSLTLEVEAAVQRLADARLCGPAPFQYAVEPALTGPQDHIPVMMAKMRSRRDVMVKAIRAIPGLSVVEPQGAFYAMPRIQLPGVDDDERFILELLHETGVLFVHGSGFGELPGTQHFRVVFLPPEQVLTEAFETLGRFIRSRAH